VAFPVPSLPRNLIPPGAPPPPPEPPPEPPPDPIGPPRKLPEPLAAPVTRLLLSRDLLDMQKMKLYH
jgi:hypothetical protein